MIEGPSGGRGAPDGLPPRRRADELDVDAVLARAPQVELVDELAHTNAPASRNAKRWQDVDDLLEAGSPC
jgi:two-component system sensor histidine kinase KdpD